VDHLSENVTFVMEESSNFTKSPGNIRENRLQLAGRTSTPSEPGTSEWGRSRRCLTLTVLF